MKVTYMSLISLGSVVGLSFFGAAAADEQDEEVRQLNLEQLERNGSAVADDYDDDMASGPDDDDWDGMGGPDTPLPPDADDEPHAYDDDEGYDDEPTADDYDDDDDDDDEGDYGPED